MICAVCEQENELGAKHCARCSSLLPPPPGSPGSAAAGATLEASRPTLEALLREVAATPAGEGAPAASLLAPGSSVGRRYEIVRQLGKGGMGAVYLARDRELSRLVALKVIAPHLAAEEWVVDRFKREIQLSSIVTHPNVLRVFDLSEADGLRFLTMQYIEGDTLAGLMKRHRPLPIEWSLALFRQIGAGLQAAHEKGVLHRDLKPQNVLVDRDRRAYLTDFGLATSASLSPLTQTGALLGTPHYMSPEQVKGQQADVRSDVFSMGVLLFEMLAGELPYAGDSVYAVMMARTRPLARSASDINPEVPRHLQALLDRCLAIGPADRYGSVAELLADLDASQVRAPPRRPVGAAAAGPGAAASPANGVPRWLAWAAVPVALALAALAGWWLWPRPGPASQVTKTVLIGDFDNRTGEDVFNGTLEPAFGLALEGAAFVSSYARAAALRVADQLKLDGAGLPEKRARLVAQREGISVVATGFVERDGAGYRVGIRAVDAFTGQKIAEESVESADRAATLGAATRLAARVRGALGDVTPEAVQLKEGETFSAASLEAAHEYSRANDLALSQGKYDEARRHYLEAIRLDPGMGRAYSGLAAIEYNRGRAAEAEKQLGAAMSRLDRMTERERQRTRGLWFMLRRDADKAIDAYGALVKQYPSDSAGHANLALAQVMRGRFAEALEPARRALTIHPRNVPQRNNLGFFAMYAGDHAAAIAEQQRVLELNPGFVNGYIGLALARQAAGERDEALATWRRLEALGPGPRSAALEGLADSALAEGRVAEAASLLEKGAEGDLLQREPEAAARKLAMLADAELARGRFAAAAAAAERALGAGQQDFIQLLAGLALAEAGKGRRALALAEAMDGRVEPLPRTWARVLRGAVARRKRQHAEAVAQLRGAVQQQDHWLARYHLALAYLDAGSAAQAADELEQLEKRRGEATDLFIENAPTWHHQASVSYWQGRAREASGSPSARDAYRAFLASKRADEEPLVADARRRLAALEASNPAR
ncbi:MAG: protein kinase [Deltaproteobacteria bacterium]|nr:protein kinase [Deltaproteobacteria bacterium]